MLSYKKELQHLSWFWLQCPKHGNLFRFLWNKVPKSIQRCTWMTFWPMSCVVCKCTFKICISWFCQQDGTYSHISNKTQACSRDIFPRFWFYEKLWCRQGIVTSLSDHNLMDFSVCGKLRPVIHMCLWKYILLTLGPKKRKKSAAVESFRGRIRQVIAAEGWHIDN